jgi:hypothetical protein
MTAVELKCPNCAAANPTGSRFCGSCGASLGDAAPLQEERKLISVWHARGALGRTAYEPGDDEAAAAYREAEELVDAFSATLAPEPAATLARSPLVDEIRST